MAAKKDSVEFPAETKDEAERMAREYFNFPEFQRYETLYLVPYEGGYNYFSDLKIAETFGIPQVCHR